MKKKGLKLGCIITCCLLMASLFVGFIPAKLHVRVATWNILHGSGMMDMQQKQMVTMDADVAALQEVDEKTDRIHGQSCLNELGKSKYYFRYFGKAKDHRNGEYGTGLLSQHYLRQVQTMDSDDEDYKGIMRGELTKNGQKISIYNVHLSGESDQIRAKQMTFVAEMFTKDTHRYKILMGDFNVRSFAEFAPFAAFKMVNTPQTPYETYHGNDWDTKALDNIIYTDTLILRDTEMITNHLSDHNALIADFEMVLPSAVRQ